MSCFSCFSSQEKKVASKRSDRGRRQQSQLPASPPPRKQSTAPPRTEATRRGVSVETVPKKDAPPKEASGNNNVVAQTFTFRELATATKNFRQDCLIGEGGFGRVYKGKIDKTGQVNANPEKSKGEKKK